MAYMFICYNAKSITLAILFGCLWCDLNAVAPYMRNYYLIIYYIDANYGDNSTVMVCLLYRFVPCLKILIKRISK
jgi:hypothetical protein